MEIVSLTNSHVKQWAKYKEKKYRDQDRRFLVEGEHLVEEAHKAGLIEELIIEQKQETIYDYYTVYEVTPEILKKISNNVSSTSIMALCHYPIHSFDALGERVLLLDDVQDPGNVGTMIRTALSFGFDSVVLSKRSVDVYNDKVLRSTQGAVFHLPILREDIDEVIDLLKKRGVPVIATSLHQAKPMSEFPDMDTIALVFGNEGNGVRKEVLDAADERLYIEMNTFESLNVAVAAGICMYRFRK